MPTSFSTPVVRPAPRWARKPRSGPLQRSSARPSSGDRGDAEPDAPGRADAAEGDERPDERQAQAAVVAGERPAGERRSRSWRPRWRKPAASRPVARWRSGSSSSRTSSPARTASIVIRTSQPKPGAGGKQASRAAAERPLAGERLARIEARARADERARGALREPEAAALPLGESGDREVGVRVEQRRESPSRSASQRRSGPGGASRSASVSAWPLPRRGSRTTRAPGARRGGGAVARAVVGDEHLGVRERCSKSADRGPIAAPRRARRRGR